LTFDNIKYLKYVRTTSYVVPFYLIYIRKTALLISYFWIKANELKKNNEQMNELLAPHEIYIYFFMLILTIN